MRRILSAALLCALCAPAAAGEMADTVVAAMDRGYGGLCGLDNRPAAAGGYYPCLDIGPYRFVKGYGTLTGFVIVGDGAPFPIFRAGDQGEGFLVRGEWVRDLAPRVASWWSDEVGGGRGRREAGEASVSRLRDAEREVMRYYPQPPADPVAGVAPVTQPAPGPPPAPAREAAVPAAQPQAPAAQSAPAAPTAADALRQAPIPTRTPTDGRELAPGVVQLPAGRPYGR